MCSDKTAWKYFNITHLSVIGHMTILDFIVLVMTTFHKSNKINTLFHGSFHLKYSQSHFSDTADIALTLKILDLTVPLCTKRDTKTLNHIGAHSPKTRRRVVADLVFLWMIETETARSSHSTPTHTHTTGQCSHHTS